jgi:hypothetical protein
MIDKIFEIYVLIKCKNINWHVNTKFFWLLFRFGTEAAALILHKTAFLNLTFYKTCGF